MKLRRQLLLLFNVLICVYISTLFTGTRLVLLQPSDESQGVEPTLATEARNSTLQGLQVGFAYSARFCSLNPGWGTVGAEDPDCVGRRPIFANSTATQLTCDNDKPTLASPLRYPKDFALESSNPPTKENSRVTIALLYFAKPALLLRQLQEFATYAPEIQSQLELLIVDDGSPPGLRASDYLALIQNAAPFPFKMVRITTERDWNIGGARNLAFYLVQTPRTLLLDLDILVPNITMEAALSWPMYGSQRLQLLEGVPDDGKEHWQEFAHRFNRKKPDGSTGKHPAVTILQTQAYWENGGCDEDFCGSYGFTDVHFWYRWKSDPRRFLMDHLDVYLEELDAGACDANFLKDQLEFDRCKASRTNLTKVRRDLKKNHKLFKQKIKKGCWSNKYLRFRWKIEHW